jgi:hypothetical protein
MSKFFINRPIVAMVFSIVMVIVGVISILSLPIAQFPNIAPPEIQISATYVGADAQTLEQAVATPIEQQVSGVDNMNYMYSLNATGNSNTTVIVNFDVKTDPNTDLILTQARETQAASQLPADVNNFGVTVRKSVSAPLMLLSLYSPHGTYDAKFLANYAYINITDPLTRAPGIGNVQVFGAGQYAMRLWVRPDQLAKLGITVPEIVSAIQAQNTVNPAGKAGGEPAPKGQEFTYSVLAQGRLASPEEFGQIVVRETPDGGTVRVRDVARIELGSQDYSVIGRLNGKPGAIIATYQLPGSNAVQAAASVRKLMAQMKERFPADMDYVVSLDQTRAVTEGIKDRYNAFDRPRTSDPCGLPFLAGLARHADSASCGTGLTRGHIRILSAVRLLHQYAFSLWSRTGHRPRCGRRHRGGRRRGTAHRGGPDSQECGLESHGRTLWTSRRDRAGSLRRICADSLYPRHYWPTLPTVRRNDRDFGAPVRIQRAYAQSCACRLVAPAKETEPRFTEAVFRWV